MRTQKEDLGELTRRDFLYLSGLGMAGMALTGVPESSQAAEKKPKYGGRLRIAERSGPPSLDAHKYQIFDGFQAYVLMYNALAIMGPLPQVNIYPDIAKSWDISPDGREYIFPLKEGVKFHDGKEMDSGDVKYSFDRVMNPATRAPKAFSYRWIDSVSIMDKYHVKIRLKEPFGPFLSTLTVQNCPIIPANSQPTPTKPAPGTGPFVFESFVPNETYELTRFDKYWEVDEKTGNRLPYLDRIYVKKIVDENVRWVALRAGDMDYIQVPPPKIAIQELKTPTPGILMVLPQPVGCTWIFFNCSKPPFNDKRVRQAIAYTIDKEQIIKGAFWGLAEISNNQPFLSRSRMYIPVEDRKIDIEKAKKLMAEAGYPEGFKTEFFERPYLNYTDSAQIAMGQLKKLGIESTMKTLDRAAWTLEMRKGNYSISMAGDSERMDPDDAYYMRLHSSEIGMNNWSRYSNKKLDELLEKGRKIWKWEDRVPVYREIVEFIKEEVPILYIDKPINAVAIRDYVKGHSFGAATWFGYAGGGIKNVWLDK